MNINSYILIIIDATSMVAVTSKTMMSQLKSRLQQVDFADARANILCYNVDLIYPRISGPLRMHGYFTS